MAPPHHNINFRNDVWFLFDGKYPRIPQTVA